jgi:hypothetical protein
MLRHIALSVVLSLAATVAWAEGDENSFCRGYIVKALAEYPIDGLSTTQLWLSWHEVVAHTGNEGTLNEAEYQSGRDKFDSLFSANDKAGIIEISDDDCDMGRHAVWLWW